MKRKLLFLMTFFILSISSFSFASFDSNIKDDILNEYRSNDVSLDYPYYKLYYNEYWASYTLFCFQLDTFNYYTSENNYIYDNMISNQDIAVYYYDEDGQEIDMQLIPSAMSSYNNSNMIYCQVVSQNTTMYSSRENILDDLGNLIYSYTGMFFENTILNVSYKFITLSAEYSSDLTSYNYSVYVWPPPPSSYKMSIGALVPSTGEYMSLVKVPYDEEYLKTHFNNITVNSILQIVIFDNYDSVILDTGKMYINNINNTNDSFVNVPVQPNYSSEFPVSPTLPVQADILDYLKYVVDSIAWLFSVIFYPLQIIGEYSAKLGIYISSIFNFLPQPLPLVFVVGIAISILIGILKGR